MNIKEIGTEITHDHPWHYDYAIVRVHKKTGEQSRILVSSNSNLVSTFDESDWSPLP